MLQLRDNILFRKWYIFQKVAHFRKGYIFKKIVYLPFETTVNCVLYANGIRLYIGPTYLYSYTAIPEVSKFEIANLTA